MTLEGPAERALGSTRTGEKTTLPGNTFVHGVVIDLIAACNTLVPGG
jgi:hypothetical protein